MEIGAARRFDAGSESEEPLSDVANSTVHDDALGLRRPAIRLVYDGEAAVFTVALSDDTFGYINNMGESVCERKAGRTARCSRRRY
ncbi:hypothetical protein C9J85_05595 [Haloferax sp. wsp5]|nr:hypothetical protein C9J85_05595 [Haloferax sp. wsp5]